MLEGFHALKHALRFGAEIDLALTSDPDGLNELSAALAPDLAAELTALVRPIAREQLRALGFAQLPHTGVVAIARRPEFSLERLLAPDASAPAVATRVSTDAARAEAARGEAARAEAARADAAGAHAARADAAGADAARAGAAGRAIVLLEDPRHLGNVGAVVRVAAGADAAGVVTTGERDPWDPAALRGSAGLHFALPVGHAGDGAFDPAPRPLIALDPDGDPLRASALPPGAVLAFGTERHGLSDALLARADQRLRIPMRAGVSSLNLATAVAAVLFAERLSG